MIYLANLCKRFVKMKVCSEYKSSETKDFSIFLYSQPSTNNKVLAHLNSK